MKFKVIKDKKNYEFIFDIEYLKYQDKLTFIYDTIWQRLKLDYGQMISYEMSCEDMFAKKKTKFYVIVK